VKLRQLTAEAIKVTALQSLWTRIIVRVLILFALIYFGVPLFESGIVLAADIIIMVIVFVFMFRRYNGDLVNNLVNKERSLCIEAAVSCAVTTPLIFVLGPYILFALPVYRLFQGIMYWVRCMYTKKVSGDLAQVKAKITMLDRSFEMVGIIPLMSLIVFILVSMNVPLQFVFIFIGSGIIFLLLSILSIKQLSIVNKKVERTVTVIPNEKILAVYYGIILSGGKGVWFGTGKNLNCENTLVLTNKRIILFQVPMPGGDNIVDGVDYTLQNVFFNRDEIIKKGKVLFSKPLNTIMNHAVHDVLYDDITRVRVKGLTLRIEADRRYKITLLDTTIMPDLERVLKSVLDDRVVA